VTVSGLDEAIGSFVGFLPHPVSRAMNIEKMATATPYFLYCILSSAIGIINKICDESVRKFAGFCEMSFMFFFGCYTEKKGMW
jgi:hypothetical protein